MLTAVIVDSYQKAVERTNVVSHWTDSSGLQQHDSAGSNRLPLTSSRPGLWTTSTLEMAVLKCALAMVDASKIPVCEWITLSLILIDINFISIHPRPLAILYGNFLDANFKTVSLHL